MHGSFSEPVTRSPDRADPHWGRRMRVLVLGGTGMLGHKLIHVLAAERDMDVHCTVRRDEGSMFRNPNVSYHASGDAAPSSDGLRSVISATKPDVVINAVGAIKQRRPEADIDRAFFVNGVLPHVIALELANQGAWLIHFSTDCVYSGTVGQYRETDPPDARDVYGRSKACGEIDYGGHLTLRTSVIGFETHVGPGLLSWLFSRPVGAEVPGYTRAIFSGLPTCTLSRTVRDLIRSPRISGLYHVAAEPISKYDLLQRIAAAFHLDIRIVPDERVVLDRSLNDTRFRHETGLSRPSWEQAIAELRQDAVLLPYHSVYPVLARTLNL